MKLVCVAPFPPGPRSTGLNLEMLPLRLALRLLGHDLSILVPTAGGRYVDVDEYPITVDDSSTTRSKLPVEIHESVSLAIYNIVGGLAPPFFRLNDFRLALDRLPLIDDGVDIVIAFKPWLRTTIPAIRLGKRCGASLVLWIDDYDVNPSCPIIDRFDAVVCNSMWLRDCYSRHSPVYLPHTIEALPLNGELPDVKPRGVMILFPGTGMPDHAAKPIVTSVLAGATDEPVTVVNAPTTLIQTVGVHVPTVTFLHFLPRGELLKRVRTQKCCVVVQTDNLYGRAKASGRVLECIAEGVPIICPDGSESARIVREGGCGLTYPPRELQSLTYAVRSIVDSPVLRATLSSGAKATQIGASSWTQNAMILIEEVSRVSNRCESKG
jgi:glycosyltransferase involved in cell wall biosynthesis